MNKCPKCGTEFEGNFCPSCGTPFNVKMFCPRCGTEVQPNQRFCSCCGAQFGLPVQPAAPAPKPAAPAPVETSTTIPSKYTGGALMTFLINYAVAFVSIISFGLLFPFMFCWRKRWQAEHTFINGRRLVFDGTGVQLFGRFMIWFLLAIATLGIYFIIKGNISFVAWETKHTHFEGVTVTYKPERKKPKKKKVKKVKEVAVAPAPVETVHTVEEVQPGETVEAIEDDGLSDGLSEEFDQPADEATVEEAAEATEDDLSGEAVQSAEEEVQHSVEIVQTVEEVHPAVVQAQPEEEEEEEEEVYVEEVTQSRFDGRWYQLLGVNALTFFVTLITIGLGAYWAHCYRQRWYSKHTVYDEHRLEFDGTGMQYFGKRFIWLLLTIITFGIYSFWLHVNSVKWTISHTHVVDPAGLPEPRG
ncbi:MAG: DUF898 family protein [Clostridia bacterium]|nr:DUF898 family protein [Clostridia bacterium]